MNPKLFPTIMIVLMILSSLVYLSKGDIRHAVYWFSGALLNISVTY